MCNVIILGDNVDCWMEIQDGKGPWAPPIAGIVPLGSTLTMVVAINDNNEGKILIQISTIVLKNGSGLITFFGVVKTLK